MNPSLEHQLCILPQNKGPTYVQTCEDYDDSSIVLQVLYLTRISFT